MIKLNDEFSKLIEREISFTNASLDEQNKLNDEVLTYLKNFSNKTYSNSGFIENNEITKILSIISEMLEN